MGMRIFILDLAVSGPARVADPERSGRRLFRHQFGQRSDAAGALAGLEPSPLTMAIPAES